MFRKYFQKSSLQAAATLSLAQRIPKITRTELQIALEEISFLGSSSADLVAAIYRTQVKDLVNQAFRCGRIDIGDLLVHYSFAHHALRLKTEEEFGSWVNDFAHLAAAAGEKKRSGKVTTLGTEGPYTIAFVTRAGPISNATLDHILPIISYLKKHHAAEYDPILYFMYSVGDDVAAAAARIGIKLRVADTNESLNEGERIERLRDLIEADGAKVAIWVHAMDSVFLLFGMRPAPVQILLSQYLHPKLSLNCIDGFVTYGAPTLRQQKFNGHKWRVIPSCTAESEVTVNTEEVRRIREKYGAPEKVIIGALARAEKIAQPNYINCIIKILQENPNTVFLWTGIEQHMDVQNRLDEAGVSSQANFIGWVDIPVFCRVIDLHCDTFPMCNGLTLLDSMSAGTACISTSSTLSYFGRDFAPALSNEWEVDLPPEVAAIMRSLVKGNFPIASNDEDYVQLANSLIRNPAERSKVGALMASLCQGVYHNEALMGAAFVAQLEDILRLKKAEQYGINFAAKSLRAIMHRIGTLMAID